MFSNRHDCFAISCGLYFHETLHNKTLAKISELTVTVNAYIYKTYLRLLYQLVNRFDFSDSKDTLL